MTLGCFIGAAILTATAIKGVSDRSFTVFFTSYMIIFLLVGMGNGSTYKMIPAIFATLGRREAAAKNIEFTEIAVNFKQQAAAVIGIAGAIGAFGGFLIQVVLRQANLPVATLVKAAETPAQKVGIAAEHADWSIPALQVFLASYVIFAATTWFFYLRKSFATDKIPSLADASI